jgi:hypothetical protein
MSRERPGEIERPEGGTQPTTETPTPETTARESLRVKPIERDPSVAGQVAPTKVKSLRVKPIERDPSVAGQSRADEGGS